MPDLLALRMAMALLTRIPVGIDSEPEPQVLGRSVSWYTLVGLVLGAALLVPLVLPAVSPEVTSLMVLLLWVWLSGGLHLDGLADTADAWVGGMGDRQRTLAILKDSHIGVFGVLALVLVLFSKWICLVALIDSNSWSTLLLAPVVGRSLIQLCFVTMPYVSPAGMGAHQAKHRCAKHVWISIVVLGLVLLIAFSWAGLGLLLVFGFYFYVFRRAVIQRLGGFTGDLAGAITEIGEALFLLLSVVLITGLA